jgi:hypothetical protein
LLSQDTKKLSGYSVKKIMEADVVITTVDLLESKGYMAGVARFAANVKKAEEVPKMPSSTGQIEKTGASGKLILCHDRC